MFAVLRYLSFGFSCYKKLFTSQFKMKTVCRHLTSSVFVLAFFALEIQGKSNKKDTPTKQQNYLDFNLAERNLTFVAVTDNVLATRTSLRVSTSEMDSKFSTSRSSSQDGENKRVSLAEIYRYRVLVSGYLIVSVIAAGLMFLLVTHFLGKRQLRRSQMNPNSPYRSFTKWELQQV